MRPIDADAMDVEKIYCYYSDHCRSEDVQEWVNEQPTLDVEPVRHGHWTIVYDDSDNEMMRCSECEEEYYDGENDTVDTLFNYCPNCGARMDLEVAE